MSRQRLRIDDTSLGKAILLVRTTGRDAGRLRRRSMYQMTWR